MSILFPNLYIKPFSSTTIHWATFKDVSKSTTLSNLRALPYWAWLPFQSSTWAVPPPPCVHQQHHLLEQMQAGFWVEILDFIQNFLHILYRFFEITSSSHTYFILITWGMKVWHPCLIGKGPPGGCMWGTWRNVLEIDLRDRNADVYLITAQFIPYCFIFIPLFQNLYHWNLLARCLSKSEIGSIEEESVRNIRRRGVP